MLLTNGVFFVDGALRADVSVRCEGGVIRQVGALSPLPGEDVLETALTLVEDLKLASEQKES